MSKPRWSTRVSTDAGEHGAAAVEFGQGQPVRRGEGCQGGTFGFDGSHGLLYLGQRRTVVKRGELKRGTLRAMLKQLDICEEDF